MERLTESLRQAPVVDRDGYSYFVHPVTDTLPQVEPELLEEIATAIEAAVDMSSVDKILTAESMGIHHATALSLSSRVPFVVARKRPYGFEDEVAVHQRTGYDEGELYVNGIHEGDRVLLLDDVLATGGTLQALHDAIETTGAEIVAVVVVIRKHLDEPADLPFEVTSLVDVSMDGDQVVIED